MRSWHRLLIRKGNNLFLNVADGRKYGKQRTGEVSKEQVKVWKEELQVLLAQPLMAGISAKYLTSGSINHAERLLKGDTHETFLGMDVSSALQDIRTKKSVKASKAMLK
jgi:ATP-dependent RNA helicase DDX24/MAK5